MAFILIVIIVAAQFIIDTFYYNVIIVRALSVVLAHLFVNLIDGVNFIFEQAIRTIITLKFIEKLTAHKVVIHAWPCICLPNAFCVVAVISTRYFFTRNVPINQFTMSFTEIVIAIVILVAMINRIFLLAISVLFFIFHTSWWLKETLFAIETITTIEDGAIS